MPTFLQVWKEGATDVWRQISDRFAGWGGIPRGGDYRLVSRLFLRLLALIYLAAFLSIGGQIVGLAGEQGILPYSETLRWAEAEYGAARVLREPTLFWIDSSDLALRGVAAAGALLSLSLLFNILPRTSLILLFICYLSLVRAGQLFMNFQWDYLLLESGFLAIFLAGGRPSGAVVWLFRWLLFRLRFLSGVSKLMSGDPSWSGFTALNVYFETQPLPHWGAWYAHQLPEWLLRFGSAATLFIELVVPLMMFLPRRLRFIAAGLTILWQLLIILTSNHNFFNLLTIVLCLFLFDDRAVRWVIDRLRPSWWAGRSSGQGPVVAVESSKARRLGTVALLIGVVGVSLLQIWEMGGRPLALKPAAAVADWARPFAVGGKYHTFPTITTERVELRVEGSYDGIEWRPYRYHYKPDALDGPLSVVIPHQPRLDWMTWFVPLGHPVNFMWFDRFLGRLVEGSPAVSGLLAHDPFPDEPPRYLRVHAFRYHFTTPEERKGNGNWWRREYVGPFL